MPSALSVPICEPRPRSGACKTWTRVERNAKQTIIAMPSARAIFTMLQRKSSKCSRNGLDVSVSGGSRNLKMSRSAIGTGSSAQGERQKTASSERGANAERVSVANFIVCDHAPNFLHTKLTAIENRFAFITVRPLFARLNWTRQKEIAALIRKARRTEIVTQSNNLAVWRQLVTGFFAQFAQGCGLDFVVINVVIIDLTRRHLPNRLPDRDPFLANENHFAGAGHRCDHDRRLAMHDCPGSRI